jgi:ABC-type lipoprotein release transport system permease subunit
MNVFKLAWRNVWRNRRRTLVTVGAMTLGLVMMILTAGLMEGFLRDLERDVLDLEVGDVQIVAGDYRENPSIYTRIEDPEALLAPLEAAGFPASARLLAFGLAAGDESAAGASFLGVDLERDARVSLVHEQLAQGSWLQPGDDHGVVLGRRLAATLDVGPGSELVVLSQGADGSMANDLYIVRGVLRGIGDGIDRSGIFMTEAAFRELLVVPDGAHLIIVRRPADVDLPATVGRVHALAPEHDVKTWRQLMPTIASYIDSARQMIFVMFFIIYIAIGILILNAMLMAVFERVREFGVLKALGVGPVEVLLLILVESAIQTVLAVGIGLALATPGILYLTHTGIDLGSLAGVSILGMALNPIWRAAMSAQVFAAPVVALLAIVAAAVLYPAFKAALIRPVDAMHHQ